MDMKKFREAQSMLQKQDKLLELMDLLGNATCNHNELAVIHDNSMYPTGAGDYDEFSIINRVTINSAMKDTLIAVVKEQYDKLKEEFEKL